MPNFAAISNGIVVGRTSRPTPENARNWSTKMTEAELIAKYIESEVRREVESRSQRFAEGGEVMLTDAQKLEILNDWFSWSGGGLAADPCYVTEYMATSYPLDYPEEEATAYLMSEVLEG